MLRYFTVLTLLGFCGMATADESWTQWRGESQNGIVAGSDFPISWSNEKGISWQSKLPGKGGSTPVHKAGKIFVTAGVDEINHLMAIDAADGSIAWDVEVGKERVSEHGKNHRKGSGSNPSAVIDGEKVFAYYRSGDLIATSLDGKVLWQTNLQDRYGEDTLWWNLGTSPIPTDKSLVIAVMQSDFSYLVGLDKESGKEIWKIDRNLDAPKESAQSYTTPVSMTVDGKAILAVLGADHLTLHDAETGKELAQLGGFNPGGEQFYRSIASPVAEGNIVVCPYARGGTLTGVDAKKLLAGEGKDAIAWFRDDLGTDVPSPAARDGKIYLLRDKDGLACLDAASGKTEWTTELPRSRLSFTASPLVSDTHLYATREDGTTFVISLENHEVVATNEAGSGEPFTVASLVPLNGDLLQRTPDQIVRIKGEK
ncbi:outer membrane biogenesis protein BamB [Roseimaritima multifibrata]|uniref:Outer membrane biogenesis protein BamB n=1 Tax=Roseimaritima multifibrata TaxID=1930274 RepID=A0A517MKJ4_9BACT|nr:PQQ-binding-like beta-propeller repeat protein [Roseimaritima multifibrata]QDS95409.1 outer membrane biogenesis protein BamB [Roseimaritima multifibrata]